jgi:hypothetical protein
MQASFVTLSPQHLENDSHSVLSHRVVLALLDKLDRLES